MGCGAAAWGEVVKSSMAMVAVRVRDKPI
jgi:hypothetical protein